MADIVLYAFMGGIMIAVVPWLNPPGRRNVAAWFERMAKRETSAKMMTPFQTRVSADWRPTAAFTPVDCETLRPLSGTTQRPIPRISLVTPGCHRRSS
jgi:hypothetical protein